MYTLLLVDDEPLELETLRDYVPWQDVDVTRVLTACDGQEALRQCAQNHVDIVLTDIKMPVMDGLSFARALPEAGCAAKVIFLSGYDDFSYVNGAYLAGGVEYILKPFVKDEVLRVVRAAQMQIVDSRKRDAAQRLYIGEQLGRWMTARDENALIALRAAQIASCALALIQTDAPRSILRQCMEAVSRYCFDVDIERGVLLAIQDAKRMHNILLRVRDELNMQEQNCGVVYFTVPAALEEMPKAYAALVQGASELFYAEKEGLLNIDGAALQAFGEQCRREKMKSRHVCPGGGKNDCRRCWRTT